VVVLEGYKNGKIVIKFFDNNMVARRADVSGERRKRGKM